MDVTPSLNPEAPHVLPSPIVTRTSTFDRIDPGNTSVEEGEGVFFVFPPTGYSYAVAGELSLPIFRCDPPIRGEVPPQAEDACSCDSPASGGGHPPSVTLLNDQAIAASLYLTPRGVQEQVKLPQEDPLEYGADGTHPHPGSNALDVGNHPVPPSIEEVRGVSYEGSNPLCASHLLHSVRQSC